MKTITIEVKDKNALKLIRDLELNHIIRILPESEHQFYSIPGNKMEPDEFSRYVKSAEDSPVMTLNEAEEKWKTSSDRN